MLDPGAWDPHRLGSKGSRELPFAVPVSIALRLTTHAAIAEAAEKFGKLLLEHRFNGDPDRGTQPLLDRIISGLVRQ